MARYLVPNGIYEYSFLTEEEAIYKIRDFSKYKLGDVIGGEEIFIPDELEVADDYDYFQASKQVSKKLIDAFIRKYGNNSKLSIAIDIDGEAHLLY